MATPNSIVTIQVPQVGAVQFFSSTGDVYGVLTPVSQIPDGNNVTQGAKADGSYVDATGAAAGSLVALGKGQYALLSAIKSILQAQRSETLWTDDTGAYFVRVEVGGVLTWTDLNGNAGAGPGTGARPASGANAVIDRAGYVATAAGAGYSVGDLLDHFYVADPKTGAAVGNFWIDITTGAPIAAPAAANISPVSPLPTGAATDQSLQQIKAAVQALPQAGAATAAGEAHIGAVSANPVQGVTASIGPSASKTYAAGQSIGGLIALPSMARVDNGTGLITSARLALNVANTNEVDVLIFNVQPTETFTDGAVLPALGAASLAAISKFYAVTAWTALNGQSFGQAPAEPRFYTCKDPTNKRSLWAVVVARAPLTLAAATDAQLGLAGGPN